MAMARPANNTGEPSLSWSARTLQADTCARCWREISPAYSQVAVAEA